MPLSSDDAQLNLCVTNDVTAALLNLLSWSRLWGDVEVAFTGNHAHCSQV